MDLKIETNSKSANFGDLVIEDSDLVMIDGKAAVLQDVLQRLRWFLGEWFLDLSGGLPFFQQIMVKNPQVEKICALFVAQILDTPGIEALLEFRFEVDFVNRIFYIRKFRAETADGVVDYAGAFAAAGG